MGDEFVHAPLVGLQKRAASRILHADTSPGDLDEHVGGQLSCGERSQHERIHHDRPERLHQVEGESRPPRHLVVKEADVGIETYAPHRSDGVRGQEGVPERERSVHRIPRRATASSLESDAPGGGCAPGQPLGYRLEVDAGTKSLMPAKPVEGLGRQRSDPRAP